MIDSMSAVTPTPIPAFAPEVRPLDVWSSKGFLKGASVAVAQGGSVMDPVSLANGGTNVYGLNDEVAVCEGEVDVENVVADGFDDEGVSVEATVVAVSVSGMASLPSAVEVAAEASVASDMIKRVTWVSVKERLNKGNRTAKGSDKVASQIERREAGIRSDGQELLRIVIARAKSSRRLSTLTQDN